MRPKDADRMANSVDPDQIVPSDLGLQRLPDLPVQRSLQWGHSVFEQLMRLWHFHPSKAHVQPSSGARSETARMCRLA